MTPKQERFVAEYLVDLNATQAAIRAGYSAKTADVQGPRLLGNVRIREAIEEGKRRHLDKAEITAERVLREIGALAFSDVTRAHRLEGEPVAALDDLSEEDRRAIQSIETVRRNLAGGDGHSDEIHKVRLWDKPKALEMLAKHFALLQERVEHSGDVTFRWAKEEGEGAA